MRRLQRVASALVVPVALVGILCLGVDRAEGQVAAQQRTVYSAKFLCGEYQPNAADQREGPVKPGNYQTAINVVNPTRTTVSFVKKAVLLFDSRQPPPPGVFEQPMPPRQRFQAVLKPNWGMEIDCADIREFLLGFPPILPGSPPQFLKGYVVLETFQSGHLLDVVAAYTSHTFRVSTTGVPEPEGFATDIERVVGTRTP
jgi:hypothetical protein